MITEKDILYIRMLFEMIEIGRYSKDDAEKALRKYVESENDNEDKAYITVK